MAETEPGYQEKTIEEQEEEKKKAQEEGKTGTSESKIASEVQKQVGRWRVCRK